MTVVAEVTAAIVMTMIVATVTEAGMMTTTNIADIGQSLDMTIITMIISEITGTMVIGLHGSLGNTTKGAIPITFSMAITSGTITSSSLCLMTG